MSFVKRIDVLRLDGLNAFEDSCKQIRIVLICFDEVVYFDVDELDDRDALWILGRVSTSCVRSARPVQF